MTWNMMAIDLNAQDFKLELESKWPDAKFPDSFWLIMPI